MTHSEIPRHTAKQQAKLAEISDTPVHAFVDNERRIRLTLPHGCYFGAGPVLRPGVESRLTMHELRVDPKLRRAGIATRLMSSMVYIARELQPDRFSGLITSPHTPRILRNVVGEAAVSYLEYVPRLDQEFTLPLTTDQAIQSIRHTLKHGDPEYDGIVASINLGALALNSLEKPTGVDEVVAQLGPKFAEYRAA